MKYLMTALLSVMMMFSNTANASTDNDATIQGLVFLSSYHDKCEPMTQRGILLFNDMYMQAGGDAILYTRAFIEAADLVANAITTQGTYATCIILRDMMIQYGLYNQLF